MKLIIKTVITIVLAATAHNIHAQTDPVKLPAGFAWGADLGGAIDLTGNDMSSINLDARFEIGRAHV